MRQRNPTAYVMAFLCAMLVACAQLGLASPETMRDKIAAAQATVTQIRSSTADLLAAKKLHSSDADNVLKTTDSAAEGIAVARTISAQDPAAANMKLTATVTVLTALQTYLASRQK